MRFYISLHRCLCKLLGYLTIWSAENREKHYLARLLISRRLGLMFFTNIFTIKNVEVSWLTSGKQKVSFLVWSFLYFPIGRCDNVLVIFDFEPCFSPLNSQSCKKSSPINNTTNKALQALACPNKRKPLFIVNHYSSWDSPKKKYIGLLQSLLPHRFCIFWLTFK